MKVQLRSRKALNSFRHRILYPRSSGDLEWLMGARTMLNRWDRRAWQDTQAQTARHPTQEWVDMAHGISGQHRTSPTATPTGLKSPSSSWWMMATIRAEIENSSSDRKASLVSTQASTKHTNPWVALPTQAATKIMRSRISWMRTSRVSRAALNPQTMRMKRRW